MMKNETIVKEKRPYKKRVQVIPEGSALSAGIPIPTKRPYKKRVIPVPGIVPRRLVSQGSVIRIDKGVPIPSGRGSIYASIYPFKTMQVGDSFLQKNVKLSVIAGNASRFVRLVKKRWRFTSRTVGKNSVRCWRVK